MTAVPKKKLTEAEYLAIERDAEFKSEFYNGEMFAMAGASRQHNELKENLSIEIGSRLKGGPCRTYSADQRVKVERTGLYTYPDLLIVCGPPEFELMEGIATLLNPQVVIEVMSPASSANDRGRKFHQFRKLPSLREYVLFAENQPYVERFVRRSDETWLMTIFDDPAGAFSLVTVPVTIPLADVYRGVELPTYPSQGP
jgi:Uma2 family endonuclease